MLIQLLVIVIVIGLLCYLVTLLPIAQPFKNIATIIVVLIAILWLLSLTGFLGGPYWHSRP
jgi:hypothetical protein